MELIFSNKPSVLNKKLIKFFDMNLLSLNKALMVFKFDVAHPKDVEKYLKRGIKNYPVLLHRDKSITGVEKIITYLKFIVKKHNSKVLNKTDIEKVDDFWKQTLGKIEVDDSGKLKPDDEDEDEDDPSADLHHKIQQAFEERSQSTELPGKSRQKNQQSHRPTNRSRGNNLEETPSQTLQNMNSNSKGGHMDDALMAQFFENQGME
jgi:hypothetical protein